jgi:hypothetical protein
MAAALSRMRLVSLLVCCLVLFNAVRAYAIPSEISHTAIPPMAAEAADILGVSSHVQRVIVLQGEINRGAKGAPQNELLWRKSVILRKILLGYLEVRRTTDCIDVALDDTYDSLDKVTRSRDRKVQLANIANFTQFGCLFNTAAYCRLKAKSLESSILGIAAATLTITFSTLALGLSYTGTSKDFSPPNALADFFALGSAAECRLPDHIDKFLNAIPVGAKRSRREESLERWKTRYRVDTSNQAALTELSGLRQRKHGEPIGLLNQRLVLLYGLNALVEEFDGELLELLTLIETPASSIENSTQISTTAEAAALKPEAIEVARLLKIQPQVARLMALRAGSMIPVSDTEQLDLEVLLLEKILGGALEVRNVVDRIDHEKHYELDIVLSDLIRKRHAAIQLNNTANFTQTGVQKSIANALYIKGKATYATEILMVMSGVNIGLSTLALYQARGGKRKLDSETNVLAHLFELDPPDRYRLSPFMAEFLNSVPPGAKTATTRKQQLVEHWKKHQILNEGADQKRLKRLSAMQEMHGKRSESIELVTTRIRMLFDVRALVETLDGGLLDLLSAVQ